MNERVIFLDIDGPVITDSMFALDDNVSNLRSYMDANALGYVATLAQMAGAKIVTNSMHNSHYVEGLGGPASLKMDLIYHGLPAKLFHKDWRTQFSFDDNITRIGAIDIWLDAHGLSLNSTDWVCFDDDKFTNRKNLILVDSRCGITYADYVEASNFWDVDVVI